LIPEQVDIIQQGDENGNGMVTRFRLPSGLVVYGLPTENFYGGHWDLGPTWNYAVMMDPPFLVDAGRRGQSGKLILMLKRIGLTPEDLDFVLISHGHEDHDGGLAELSRGNGLKIRAHRIYKRLIRRYPQLGPAGTKQDFPAKCWHCFMPSSFFREHCLGYHKELGQLQVDSVGDGTTVLTEGTLAHHLPGHSPDCLAVQVGQEAILVGDIVLPDISPWPTRKALYKEVGEIIRPAYAVAGEVFGLQRYLVSLRSLLDLSHRNGGLQVFPAHRLFYKGKWNGIGLADRVAELMDHHVQRCGAILEILSDGPRNAAEISRDYFDPDLLKGVGHLMAENEIDSHCELLLDSGDIVALKDGRYATSGSSRFENHISAPV
jgi:glyoxylase-like metal-dependent hydrolase (beta-lactamase superfamily II)